MRKLRRLKSFKAFLIIIFISSTLFHACTKIDTKQKETEIVENKFQITNRFFNVSSKTDKITYRAINEIKKRNFNEEFVTGFATKLGYPVWDKAIIKVYKASENHNFAGGNSASNANPDTTLIIPFALADSNFVNGFIVANINDTVNLFYKLAKDYKAYPESPNNTTALTPNKFASLIMYLDKNTFGYSKFLITDYNLLFKTNNNGVSNNHTAPFIVEFRNPPPQNNMTTTYEICDVLIQSGNCNCTRQPCDMCLTSCAYIGCYEITITSPNPTGGGPSGPSSPTGGGPTGGGSGGGIPYDPPPCNPNIPVNPSIVASNAVPGDPLPPCPPPGGGTGWNPIIFNPLIAPPIILDTSITNNFPCVQRIIDSLSSFMSINAIAQKALHDVFNINKNIHTTLKINWNLTKDSADGMTNENLLLSNNNNNNDFYATINLNPWMLRNSTQEYIAATIIHEAFHSYIDYKFYQYRNAIIDSNEYKILFPLYWPPRGGTRLLNAGERRQHNVMAANLIEIMAAPLFSINSNPFITNVLRDSIYKALSWGGLQETTIWKTKADTNDIRAINSFARDTSIMTQFQLLDSNSLPFGTIYTSNSHTLHMKKGCQ